MECHEVKLTSDQCKALGYDLSKHLGVLECKALCEELCGHLRMDVDRGFHIEGCTELSQSGVFYKTETPRNLCVLLTHGMHLDGRYVMVCVEDDFIFGTLLVEAFEMRVVRSYSTDVTESQWATSTNYGALSSLSWGEKKALAFEVCSCLHLSGEKLEMLPMPSSLGERRRSSNASLVLTAPLVIDEEMKKMDDDANRMKIPISSGISDDLQVILMCGTKLNGKSMVVCMNDSERDHITIHCFNPLSLRTVKLAVSGRDWSRFGFQDLKKNGYGREAAALRETLQRPQDQRR